MKQQLIIIFLFIFILPGLAQEPDWLESKGRTPRLPEHMYITGMGIATVGKKADPVKIKEIAEENAKKNLCEKIQVKVKSATEAYKLQIGNSFEQHFKSTTESFSNIEIPGLKKEYYYDKKKNLEYCLVYAEKNQLIQNYEHKILDHRKSLLSLYQISVELERSGRKMKALESYLDCVPILSRIKEYQSILIGLGKYPDNNLEVDQVTLYRAINSIYTTVNSLDDLAFFIAYVFKEQLNYEQLKGVVISPLTYRNTGMSSEFSKKFRETLETNLLYNNGWIIYPVKKYAPTLDNMNLIRYAVRGTYWETDSTLKINVYINEILTGEKLASIDYEIDRTLIEEEYFGIIPKDFGEKYQDQMVFNSNKPEPSGLILEAWTNKGKEDLLFTRGEIMNVYVKTNIPCYLQLIYHLSDGKRILYINNEFIDESNINTVYELPYLFVCQEPFGIEILQISASENPFPPMKTDNIHGIRFITDDLPNILAKTRENSTHDDINSAEARLLITTMPN